MRQLLAAVDIPCVSKNFAWVSGANSFSPIRENWGKSEKNSSFPLDVSAESPPQPANTGRDATFLSSFLSYFFYW
jgi:hypothetical protein